MPAEPFIGEIAIFGFSFVPRGWAACDGQLLPISQFTALFSLIGTTYGGDGRVNFALPDLRGRIPMHFGAGPGLSPYAFGDRNGAEAVTLTTAQLPSHSHALHAATTEDDATDPTGRVLAVPNRGIYTSAPADATMSSTAIGTAGGGQPVDIRQPYLTLNICIALEGIFPSRS